MKSCKSHEKNEKKQLKNLSFLLFTNRFKWFFFFFYVVCKISNFNKWTAQHLAKAPCTELTLQKFIFEVWALWTQYLLNDWNLRSNMFWKKELCYYNEKKNVKKNWIKSRLYLCSRCFWNEQLLKGLCHIVPDALWKAAGLKP